MRVAVVGAGVVGCAIALTLRRRGAEVVLFDRDAPGSGCSSGNSGAISPGSVVPLAMPGVLASVPSMLLDDESPLYLPLAYLPRALPWLLQFVAAARPSRVEEVAASLDTLHKNALQMHREMARDIGVPELLLERGHLHLYPDASALAKDTAGWRLRRQYGWTCEQLDRGDIEVLEPNAPKRYAVGMHVADHATILNPQRYVQAMATAFVSAGGELRQAAVSAIERDGRLWRLNASPKSASPANGMLFDQLVVAAGAWSRSLLDPLGLSIPLESQRGYHVQFNGVHDLVSRTVILADRKVFVTPMEEGVRVGGTVEIGGLTRPPDLRRAALLERIARESFPSLANVVPTTWMGHRPCTPDSLPVVGPAKGMAGLWLAVGHGHLGMTDSLPTAKRIADGILGATTMPGH